MREPLLADDRPVKQPRFPRLLSGIGGFTCAAAAFEILARCWPGAAYPLLSALSLFGIVWLAIVVLRTCERSRTPEALSAIDRVLIYWSGPLSVLLLLVTPGIAFANIAERTGGNYFTSTWGFDLVEGLTTSGFVLSVCCLATHAERQVPPGLFWKLICIPLLVIFGAYTFLMPIACTAVKLGLK